MKKTRFLLARLTPALPVGLRAAVCAACCALLCVACAGVKSGAPASRVRTKADPVLEAEFDRGYWVTPPSGSSITIIGMAGRRANRREALQEALLDAARKAALYHGVHGETSSSLIQGTGNLDYYSDFDYRLDPHHPPEEYLDALLFDEEWDVLEKNGVVVVRVRYQGVSGIAPYTTVLENGVPDWTKRYVAAIPGVLTGIGYSKNRGSPQKTYQSSYERALVSLVAQLSAQVTTEVVDVNGNRMIQNSTQSEGDLAGVMILETWFDWKSKSVWTLVAARVPEAPRPSGTEP